MNPQYTIKDYIKYLLNRILTSELTGEMNDITICKKCQEYLWLVME